MLSLKNEYVVIDRHADEIVSSDAHPTRLQAVEADNGEPCRLLDVDLRRGVARVERNTPERGYFEDTLPAYWLCSRLEKAAAAAAAVEAKMWAGCPHLAL